VGSFSFIEEFIVVMSQNIDESSAILYLKTFKG
jgi:hypothetical protein